MVTTSIQEIPGKKLINLKSFARRRMALPGEADKIVTKLNTTEITVIKAVGIISGQGPASQFIDDVAKASTLFGPKLDTQTIRKNLKRIEKRGMIHWDRKEPEWIIFTPFLFDILSAIDRLEEKRRLERSS